MAASERAQDSIAVGGESLGVREVAPPTLPKILDALPLSAVGRIAASLEGDWSPSAVDVWRRGAGGPDFSRVVRRHPLHRPSLELYVGEAWIGVPCFVREGGENVFDEELARAIVRRVEAGSPQGDPSADGSVEG